MLNSKLLYISGSFPDNQEGIAAGAKVLLDELKKQVNFDRIVLLTTKLPIIEKFCKHSETVKVEYMQNWKVSPRNIKKFFRIIKENKIDVIHMEYPGDCYGKTLLASFLPLIIKTYNLINNCKISFNVRLHEFTRARLLRKIVIVPILFFSTQIYIPSLNDRVAARKFAHRKVKQTIIGSNIAVSYFRKDIEKTEKRVISYFGGVYPGKGIEKMLYVWKKIHEKDTENIFTFKIIGEVNPFNDNHFSEYHKKVFKWLQETGMKDHVEITGYVSDEKVSEEIMKSNVATLLYEDGLTLRRGSFIAYLAHGKPIVTSYGDEDSRRLIKHAKGIAMLDDIDKIVDKTMEYALMNQKALDEISKGNMKIATFFDWNRIARRFLRDYNMVK